MLKKSMEDYYEEMYENKVDFESLKNIKKLAPFKRIKKELVKKYCRGNSILELGCGLGEYISMFNSDIYGSDIALNALKKAKIFCPEGKFFQANAESLPLKDESFDCILLPDVLEHVENDEKLLNELKRIVKKNGRIIIITQASNKYETIIKDWNKTNPTNIKGKPIDSAVNLGTNVVGEGGDLRYYGLDLANKLSNMGLMVKVIRFLGGPLTKNINKFQMKMLKRKGYDRSDILKGNLDGIKRIGFYSKILYSLYKLDYFIFGRLRGKFILLIIDKK